MNIEEDMVKWKGKKYNSELSTSIKDNQKEKDTLTEMCLYQKFGCTCEGEGVGIEGVEGEECIAESQMLDSDEFN